MANLVESKDLCDEGGLANLTLGPRCASVLESIVKSHHNKFVKFASVFVGPDQAEDIVQTAYLKLANDDKLTDGEIGRVYNYVKRAVYWSAQSSIRSGARQGARLDNLVARHEPEAVHEFNATRASTVPDERQRVSSTVDAISKTVCKLAERSETQKQRAQIFFLRYADVFGMDQGLAGEEIARTTGVPEKTVWSALHKFTRDVRDELLKISA